MVCWSVRQYVIISLKCRKKNKFYFLPVGTTMLVSIHGPYLKDMVLDDGMIDDLYNH